MDQLEKLEQRVEVVIARIRELEAANKVLLDKNSDLTRDLKSLRAENKRLKTETDSVASNFSEKEAEVKNRLESILSEVEKIELEMSDN
jgi:septation ring formation regulator EzrA